MFLLLFYMINLVIVFVYLVCLCDDRLVYNDFQNSIFTFDTWDLNCLAAYFPSFQAEVTAVECKMLRKGLVEGLLCMLDKSLIDLLVLTVTFLKKISIYEENKVGDYSHYYYSFKVQNLFSLWFILVVLDTHIHWITFHFKLILYFIILSLLQNLLRETPIVSKLSQFLTCNSAQLIQISLRLLFNLSFDEVRKYRIRMNSWMMKKYIRYSIIMTVYFFWVGWSSIFVWFNVILW